MLRTKLYLTRAISNYDRETAVYAFCHLDGRREKIYLPLTVRPSQWDTKTQRFRRTFTNWSEANHLLKKLPDELEAARLRLLAKGQIVTKKDLEAVAALILGGPAPTRPDGLLAHLDAWIEANRRDKAPGTIKAYGTFRKHLAAYAKSHRQRLEFANVDNAFCEGFKSYLLRTVGLGNASINNLIKNLKTFLGATFEQEVHEFAHYRRFRKMEALEPDVVYLTTEEKARIACVPLADLPRLEQSRDAFVFACETGLRFSDLEALRPDQVKEGVFTLTTKKTDTTLKVPLSQVARDILARYAGLCGERALPVKTNPAINRDLKTIAQLARLDTPTTTVQQKGKDKILTTRPKHELITMHSARRTFVTLALEGGMRQEMVMAITGHKTALMLHRYLKITDSVVQKEFAEYEERQAISAIPAPPPTRGAARVRQDR